MNDFEQKLKAYAELTVKVGVNIQPGQTLIVHAPVESKEFVRLIVKEAYDSGAALVKVQWNDEQITRMQYELAADEVFSKEPKWTAGEMTELVEQGAAVLHILSENPDLLKGVKQERIVASQRHAAKRWRSTVLISRLINSAGASSLFHHPNGQLKCSLMHHKKNKYRYYGTLFSIPFESEKQIR